VTDNDVLLPAEAALSFNQYRDEWMAAGSRRFAPRKD